MPSNRPASRARLAGLLEASFLSVPRLLYTHYVDMRRQAKRATVLATLPAFRFPLPEASSR